MENNNLPQNNASNNNSATSEQPSILQDTLLDAADMSGYDKSLKRARIWLYVITGMQIVMGVYEYATYNTESAIYRWLVFGADAGIGLIFLACALWSFKKPVAAFLTALILYIVITGTLMVLNPSNITSGIIIKVFVVIALIRAYKDAKHMEEMKQLLVG